VNWRTRVEDRYYVPLLKNVSHVISFSAIFIYKEMHTYIVNEKCTKKGFVIILLNRGIFDCLWSVDKLA